ncbi:spore germination protein [Melghirimyces profundicolus]|uniref:Spore germination protein n=1 Tax=Melghirimyces profundicolus TaxID=1242148 RepID=A0A2T6BUW5_9BACL|nr:germination protein YpeB [Melghirimyces profundicolus]PTX59881.1 spore germination protein [Melghirimyces profundicolus]
MYRRIAAVLFPVTALALIGAAVWGYQENQEKNSLLIKAENQYQRAFHDLNFHMDKLQDELGKALALNTRKQLSNCMTDVWRLSFAAQNDVGQLPLSMMPFDKTEAFLSRIGNFTHRVGVRDLDKKPLTDREYNTLRTLYKRAGAIQKDLQNVQSQVLSKNLRWMDVELEMAAEDKAMDNTIINGFKKVDKLSEGYEEVDWGPSVNNLESNQRKKTARLKGKPVTPAEVKEKMADILDRPDTRGMEVVRNRKNDTPTYSVRVKAKNGREVFADVTRKGGHVLWLNYDRPVKNRKLNLEQAQAEAIRFLDRLGYPEMEAIHYDETGNMAGITFVRKQGNVLIYPESLVVKVALDNGEITGYQGDNYVFNYKANRNLKPKLTLAEARKSVNPRLKVKESRLAVIFGENGKETLCYEFLGQLGKSRYRLFINAQNGDEEAVEKIKDQNLNTL